MTSYLVSGVPLNINLFERLTYYQSHTVKVMKSHILIRVAALYLSLTFAMAIDLPYIESDQQVFYTPKSTSCHVRRIAIIGRLVDFVAF